MAIFDVLEFLDDTGEIMVARMPMEGSGQFTTGSQLVVQESQFGVFFRDGQMLDIFGPGRHTLSTQNLPLLGKLIGLPFGGTSPFRASVYFVATKTFVNLGWGTNSPVVFRDADFRMITLRAFGVYSMRIVDPRVFLNTLVGTRGLETTFALEDFFRSAIVSRLNEKLGSIMKSILDLPVHYGRIAQETRDAVALDFSQYGLELVDLMVQAITPPKEVQEMINRASGIAAQDVGSYQAIAAADAMRDAAKNPSGNAGEGMGAGLGIALGLGMAQRMSQVAAGVPVSPAAPASAPLPAAADRLEPGELRAKLLELKALMDDGLINEQEFAEQKKALLARV